MKLFYTISHIIMGIAIGLWLFYLMPPPGMKIIKESTDISTISIAFDPEVAPIPGHPIAVVGYFPSGFDIIFDPARTPTHKHPVWVNDVGHPGILIHNDVQPLQIRPSLP